MSLILYVKLKISIDDLKALVIKSQKHITFYKSNNFKITNFLFISSSRTVQKNKIQMSAGLSSEYSYHSENGPAYHKNPLGASPFKNIKNINVRSFIAQPSEPPSTKIGLQKPYIFSIFGIGRILLILALLGGWIAAVVVVRDNENAKADGYGGFTSTRIAYLVFVIAAFIVYTIIFVLEALNIFNVFKILRKLPLQIIVRVNYK